MKTKLKILDFTYDNPEIIKEAKKISMEKDYSKLVNIDILRK